MSELVELDEAPQLPIVIAGKKLGTCSSIVREGPVVRYCDAIGEDGKARGGDVELDLATGKLSLVHWDGFKLLGSVEFGRLQLVSKA